MIQRLLLLVLFFVSWIAAWCGGPLPAAAAQSAPWTVTAIIRIADDAKVEEQPVHLVGLAQAAGPALAGSSESGGEAPVFTLVWAPDQAASWWGVTWAVQLEVGPGWLVTSASEEAGGTIHERMARGHVLLGPRPGNEYESTISYDPVSGWVSAAVVDRTLGLRLYAARARVRFEGEAPSQTLWPSPALERPGVTLVSQRVADAFVPVDAEWEIALRSEPGAELDREGELGRAGPGGVAVGSDSLTPLRIDRRRVRELALRVHSETGSGSGRFRLSWEGSSGQGELFGFAVAAGQAGGDPGAAAFAALATASLPVGESELIVEYVDGEHTWLLGRRTMRVGALEVAISPLQIEGDRWKGQVTLAADGDMPGAQLLLALEATPISTLLPGVPIGKEVYIQPVLALDLGGSWETSRTVEFSLPKPSLSGLQNHPRWHVRYLPEVSAAVDLRVRGEVDELMISGGGRYEPPAVTVEVEEEIYRFVPPNNGAGPMWARGSSALIRRGDKLFVTGIKTLPDAQPLNNVVPVIYQRVEGGWKVVYEGSERTREPSPLAAFADGRLFLSINPTLAPPDAYAGPAEPRILAFDMDHPEAGYETLLPRWDGNPPFTEHSYRSFAADADNGELILFQNIGYTHAEWAFYDRHGEWSASGRLVFPWAKEYDEPGPVRLAYPPVVLKDRAVYFFGVSDVVEPYTAWRQRKREITGQDWDYDFRRLFFTWSDDIRTGKFHQWIEIATRDSTAGWLTPYDLYVDDEKKVHLLWTERALDERLRAEFFPLERQTHTLNYAVFQNGVVLLRRVLHIAGEGYGSEIAERARFHITPSGRLFVVYLVRGAGSQLRLAEIFPDGSVSPPVPIPLAYPMLEFNATPRGGSEPSEYLDIIGLEGNAVRYARVRIDAE